MATPQRHVRHLRLVAGSEAAARAAVTQLEDALRCASLPDTGARLLLVRRLALGDLGRHASSQTIARVIEARFADRAVTWISGETIDGESDSPQAEHVVFPSAWHARVALASRLLRGQRCAAWYWPLAVPEFRARIGAGDNVRSITRVIAQSDEAVVALPAWAVQVVRQTGTAALSAVVPAALGEQLIRAAGVRGVPAGNRDEAWSADLARPASVPTWLQSLLQAGGWRAQNTASRVGASVATAAQAAKLTRAVGPASRDSAQRAGTDRATSSGKRGGPARQTNGGATIDVPAAPNTRTRWTEVDSQTSSPAAQRGVSQTVSITAAGPLRNTAAAPTTAVSHHPSSTLDPAPTAGAGLLFVLPVLARLGLPQWAEKTPDDATQWTRAVLAAALLRLRMPADDPIWALVAHTTPLSRIDAPAPPPWHDPLLAAPHGQALTKARTGSAQVQVWLAAVRYWLRRGAHLGLATLVRRPGWVCLTPSHADLFFRLCDADRRIRQPGLDIDPGWLPWFGRVVAFHYGDAPQPL